MEIKTYSDCWLYQKYPMYRKRILDAVVKDPMIDKGTEEFKDVIYEVKRTRVSEALIRVLKSTNTVLLDCENPMPRTLKVFYARDPKSKGNNIGRVFIDCTGVIVKESNSKDYRVDDVKLLSYLINGAVCMIYHKAPNTIARRSYLIESATDAFAKCFTSIIDYLVKVSIQESNKVKILYLSSMYFLEGILKMGNEQESRKLAKRIAGIGDREAGMLDILLDKVSHSSGDKEPNPFENIKTFIASLRDVMKYDQKVISKDVIVERWMMQFGPGTVFALEYFPAFSAMMTDAYQGGYLNQQRSIEKVCDQSMVQYSKYVISMIEGTV